MPDISKIRLPGNPGNVYDIKDAVAREMISGGISFIIAWTASDFASTTTPTAAKLATIPAGVEVAYNSGTSTATGTLAASIDTKAKFYLIYSKTQAGNIDNFDEYVTVENGGDYIWEKIGDTQIDLSDVVTGVSLSKQTDTVIGTDATFTVTQPTITLAEDSSTGVTFVRGGTTKYMKATASGAAVTPSTTNIKATASGGETGWNDKDSFAAVTGYPNTTSDTFVKSVSAETGKNLVTTSIVPTNGTESVSKVTKTASKLVTTTVPNVTGNTSVTIPNVTDAGSASTWTFTMGSGADAETLIISGANSTAPTLGTSLTATNTTLGTAKTVATGSVASTGTGSDVITAVTISDKTVAKAGTAVTVATGETSEDGTGDAVVTGVTVGTSGTALTGLGSPSTHTGVGMYATFTNTQPKIALSTGATAGTGVISVATGISSVTQPTIALAAEDSSATGRAEFVQSVDTSKKMKGTASGANTAWNSKDSVTVLKSTTDVAVTKGNA